MIKKWIQFIKESNHYWLKESDIQESFISLRDEGYKITVKKYLFTDKNSKTNKEIEFLDPFLTIYSTKNKYYLGYKIIIHGSLDRNSDDITLDFKSSINHLKDEGFILHKVFDEEDETSIDNLYLSKGCIISWIPEKSGKSFYDDYAIGDIYTSSKYLDIYIYQPEENEITHKDIAEIYDWSQYSTDSDGNIYLELDIEELAELVLSKTTYLDELVNGIDSCNWYNTNKTDVLYSFNYELNHDNKILSIKSIIKEIGGINIFINECNRILDENGHNDNLNGKSEEELISIFMKFNLTNPKYKCLQYIIKNSEIISEIVEVISDFEIQSKTENNQLELENEFDKILKEENIEFTKFFKRGKKYFYKKIEETSRIEKVYYDGDIWFYKLKFQERWIVDLEDSLYGQSLKTTFTEWCENKYFNNELSPNFSDYASVDEKLLDSEIENILKKFLK